MPKIIKQLILRVDSPLISIPRLKVRVHCILISQPKGLLSLLHYWSMGRLVHFVNSTTAIYMKRKQNRYNTFQFAQIVAKKASYKVYSFELLFYRSATSSQDLLRLFLIFFFICRENWPRPNRMKIATWLVKIISAT